MPNIPAKDIAAHIGRYRKKLHFSEKYLFFPKLPREAFFILSICIPFPTRSRYGTH